VPTGDSGRFDDAGYLHLTGRKRDIFITAYGRNVAPEWVECELTATASIVQAFVCGEARPWNIAVIVPHPAVLTANPENWQELVGADIAKVNDSLPDYARVQRWLPAREPFHPGNDLLTWNGRLRRAQLAATYAEGIGHLYDKEPAYVH
jgi:long-subunit acyl-CoA synthetase (AMP-forming)